MPQPPTRKPARAEVPAVPRPAGADTLNGVVSASNLDSASPPLAAARAGDRSAPARAGGRLRARLGAALAIAAAWTAFALMTTAVSWTNFRGSGEQTPTFGQIFRALAVAPAVWALLTPLILVAARRWTFSRDRWIVPLLQHLALAMGVGLAVALVERFTWPMVRYGAPPALGLALVQGLVFRIVLYGAIVGGAQSVLHRRRLEEGRAQELALRAQLADERVRVLSLQLEPHFLYNTLHAISELVHVDAGRADRAIMRLADLLRSTTLHGARPQIALREELALAAAYAELLHLRWGDGLAITIDAPEEVRDLAVPPLLLQPLVENAVRHGIGRREGGTVRVRAAREGDELVVAVDDDGAGPPAGPPREGLGLGNTRLRLEHLHGPRGRLAMSRSPLGGARVEVRVPAIRMAPAREGAA